MHARQLVLLAVILLPAIVRGEALLIEAERLELTGGWHVLRASRVVRQYVFSGQKQGAPPVVGAVQIPRDGEWRLWVRSRDFANDRPGIRHFTVRIGAIRSDRRFGTHAQEGLGGWEWEDGGTFQLRKGATLIAIGEQAQTFARCDALVLTDNLEYRPKGMPKHIRIPAAEMMPLDVRVQQDKAQHQAPRVERVSESSAAKLANKDARWTFHRANGGEVVAARCAAKVEGKWRQLDTDVNAEGYHVVFCDADHDPGLQAERKVFPVWNTSFSPAVEASAGGVSVMSRLSEAHTPWQAGRHHSLRPTAVRQVDERTVELRFDELPVGRLTATWRVMAELPAAHVTLAFTAARSGRVTLGYHGALAARPDKDEFHLLPFMYHGHRLPARPTFLLNSHTPTPIALVNRKRMSYALVADPKGIPFQWPSLSSVRFALGIRNRRGEAQPMLYAPVLGLPESKVEPGQTVTARFCVWLQPGDWYAAFRRVATGLFRFDDYRRPTQCSLSDAALNIFDLLKDAEAAGWDDRAKGPWNIETRNRVTHASPLTYMSYYLLTGDEGFYDNFARPALEFLLSRPSPFFIAKTEGDATLARRRLRGPVSLYGATTYAGAYAMTHGRSPAFADFALDAQGEPRHTRGYGHSQVFEDALALHRLTGDRKWLSKAIAGGDDYVRKHVRTLPKGDLGKIPFINLSFMLDWEGLLHLAEASGEPRFLEAAAETARWLLTTIWTQPLVPRGDTTVHPGGRFRHSRHVWWYGDRRFRLGIVDGDFGHEKVNADDVLPPTPLPEKTVAAWKASNVGLGLEQPCTYTRRETHAHILMSTWAPNLLRLARLTGDTLFRTVARNATIGRFGNYPGYYVQDFTDRYHRPDYPLVGPDVTSLYYHHAPPFAAYVLDYLFTDAEVRSNGQVAFPWVRQFGYAWFDCRLRGHAPGRVYGCEAWPWLHRTAATVDTVNVDRVLAHGGGKFHVVLLNQTRDPQPVRVTFDEAVLNRELDGARVSVMFDNEAASPLAVSGNSVSLTLTPLGIAALTLDGAKIDVPTHGATPPRHIKLPGEPAVVKAPFEGSDIEARAAWITAPPFEWRDLYVYLTAGAKDCERATLHYRVGDGPRRSRVCRRFPFEFSVRVDDLHSPIMWHVEIQTHSGKRIRTPTRSFSDRG